MMLRPMFFAGIALLAPKALGQEGSAILEGAIRDSHSSPLSTTTVLLLNSDKVLLSREIYSAEVYLFAILSGGTYTLRAQLVGFTQSAFGPFLLTGAKTKHVDLTLAAEAEFF